jgi:ABC-type multidrug transport system ATPase subunit
VLVQTESLAKRYGRLTALSECSFAADRGEIVGLLGPNGAGKTTLLRLLLGFLKPTAGRAAVDGIDCYRQPVAVHRRLTYLPGEARLFRHCTDYDCPRAARRCDLDHDVPWPRGPTDIDNLAPRCRRDHERKTRGLVRTRLHPDGSLTTTMLTGLVTTTRPEPLPGYDIGEQRPGSLGAPGEHPEVDPAA